jgi:hypothetical protein
MRLHSILFRSYNDTNYERLARVLVSSAAENSPATPLELHRIREHDFDLRAVGSKRRGPSMGYIENTRKSRHHTRLITAAADGDVLGMLDCDTMILRDLSPVADLEFDLAYTVRPADCRYKLNTGVYFVRVSNRIRRWMTEWHDTCLKMLADEAFHFRWRTDELYGGIHQAALGWMLAHNRTIRFLELECAEWNSVSSTWGSPRARVVHVMGQLRKMCFGQVAIPNSDVRKVVEKWRGYDDALGRSARQAAG